MGRDEQVEEREVLDSIFPDEITDVSDTAYRISVTLDIPQEDGDESTPRKSRGPDYLESQYGKGAPSAVQTFDLLN